MAIHLRMNGRRVGPEVTELLLLPVYSHPHHQPFLAPRESRGPCSASLESGEGGTLMEVTLDP